MITPHPLPNKIFKLPFDKQLDLSKPNIMGILNITPDSFSDGGKYHSMDLALQQCEAMLSAGVSIIDVGGESTRPNAKKVTEAEEMARVLPIIEAINQRFDTIISVDTSTPAVIKEAYHLGAHIWNDVRALKREGAVETAIELAIPVILMHMRGEPHNMMDLTNYDNVVTDVKAELQSTVEQLTKHGVIPEKVILDVGFGFAKNTKHNYQLLANLAEFHHLGFPLMIGLSRKRMLADALNKQGLNSDIKNRITGGLTASVLAILQGVSIVRTHDVLATAQALSVLNCLKEHSI